MAGEKPKTSPPRAPKQPRKEPGSRKPAWQAEKTSTRSTDTIRAGGWMIHGGRWVLEEGSENGSA